MHGCSAVQHMCRAATGDAWYGLCQAGMPSQYVWGTIYLDGVLEHANLTACITQFDVRPRAVTHNGLRQCILLSRLFSYHAMHCMQRLP